tara:strand:- start:46 stop:420 length:375 start_codon:yes stop_codon:yes gene_type:complete
MIDSDIEKKEKEVVDAIIECIETNKEAFYYDRNSNYLAFNNENGSRIVQIPYVATNYKINYKEYFYLYDKPFKLSFRDKPLEDACTEVFNHIEAIAAEADKQKRLTRLDEVHTMLTGLIYGGNN